jgi:hypothetical protein
MSDVEEFDSALAAGFEVSTVALGLVDPDAV